MPIIKLPTVVHDIDTWIASIDGSIRLAADEYEFSYTAPVPPFDLNDRIPGDVYTIIDHYTKRGFFCVYDGNIGTLRISWDHPNMSYQDVKNTTRAGLDLIFTIGDGFPASKLYLCMTNGQDLRATSDISLSRELQQKIYLAAASGEKFTTFRFEGVPFHVIESLYALTFSDLRASGYGVTYDPLKEYWVIRWDDGLMAIGYHGTTLELDSLN